MTWKAMCKREANMTVTCAWCGKQIIDSHDCPERRAAMAQADQRNVPTVADALFDDEDN